MQRNDLTEFPIDVIKNYENNVMWGPYIIPLTILFIFGCLIELLFALKKGEIYEKGILEGTSFYPFTDMEQILEEGQIRLLLKKRKRLRKTIRLSLHEKEKDRIRDILCDKVAYEQIFY